MALEQLLKRLHIEKDGLVIIQEPAKLSPDAKRKLLLGTQSYLDQGTVGVLADCRLNVDVLAKGFDPALSNQERLILGSGHLLQLLTLQPACRYTNHPSLMFGSVGKYSDFLSRFSSLDFPYGNPSIFQDFYELNAVFLVDDPTEAVFAAYPYIVGRFTDPIIRKNTSFFDYEVLSFLDYDVADKQLGDFNGLKELFLSEYIDDKHKVYAVSFRELVDIMGTKI